VTRPARIGRNVALAVTLTLASACGIAVAGPAAKPARGTRSSAAAVAAASRSASSALAATPRASRNPAAAKPTASKAPRASAVRASALRSIAILEDRRKLEGGELIRFLSSSDAILRARAALAIGRLQDSTTVVALRPLLRDRVAAVREEAAFALGQIGHRSARHDLERLLAPAASGTGSRSAKVAARPA
jgi:HEAT repeat protein